MAGHLIGKLSLPFVGFDGLDGKGVLDFTGSAGTGVTTADFAIVSACSSTFTAAQAYLVVLVGQGCDYRGKYDDSQKRRQSDECPFS